MKAEWLKVMPDHLIVNKNLRKDIGNKMKNRSKKTYVFQFQMENGVGKTNKEHSYVLRITTLVK